MSILIKGMRMPENCIKCPMQYGGMCYVMPAEVDESRVAPTVEEALKQGKPDWCPLVEVPEPHGRLIDYDWVVENVIKKLGIKDKQYLLQAEKALMILVDEAPTVIEAEVRTNERID